MQKLSPQRKANYPNMQSCDSKGEGQQTTSSLRPKPCKLVTNKMLDGDLVHSTEGQQAYQNFGSTIMIFMDDVPCLCKNGLQDSNSSKI